MVAESPGIMDEQRALYESMRNARAIRRERWYLRVSAEECGRVLRGDRGRGGTCDRRRKRCQCWQLRVVRVRPTTRPGRPRRSLTLAQATTSTVMRQTPAKSRRLDTDVPTSGEERDVGHSPVHGRQRLRL